MPDAPPPEYTIDDLGTRPLTQAFHTVSGTGQPGSQLFVQLQKSPWGTLDPAVGTPEYLFTGKYRAPKIHGQPDLVTVGEDGTWSLDLGEVPDGQYWIVVQDVVALSPAVTAELRVWSSPFDRAQQRPDPDVPPLLTGPPLTYGPPAPEQPENYLFTVDPPSTSDLTQSFHTVSGTGVPGTELVVSGESVTVGEDGTWAVDLGEISDGEQTIHVQDRRGLFTETTTIQVWSSPGHRIEQQKAHGVYVPPEQPFRYIAPDGSIFSEDDPPEPQGPPAPKSEPDIEESKAEDTTAWWMHGRVWWLVAAAMLALLVVILGFNVIGGDGGARELEVGGGFDPLPPAGSNTTSSTADEGATVEEPEELVAVDVGAEALVGSYRGALMFFPPPGDPSTVVFESNFMVTIEPDEGDGYAVIFTQEPSSQVTVGTIDPTGRAVHTSGGDESKYQEFYMVQVRPIGSHQLEIVGVHFGGPPDLAEREEELLLALTTAEFVDGVLVVAPGADPITGGPLSPAQALAVATEMILPGVDRTELGIDWFLVVHGVLDLSDSSTETSTGVPEHEVTIGNIRYVIRAVTEVNTGADLGFTVCGYDVDSGEPLEGETGYFTIGQDPGSSLASHANGIFGPDGCFSGSVPVKEPPGITQGFVSDGSAVEKWGIIAILPGEDPPEEDPEQFLRLLVDGLRGDVDFLVSRLNDATIVIYGEEQCRATLAGLSDPQTELEIREIGPITPWDYVVDGITTRIPDALPVEVQRLADGQTIIQELHWQMVDGLWTWFSDCGDPIPG